MHLALQELAKRKRRHSHVDTSILAWDTCILACSITYCMMEHILCTSPYKCWRNARRYVCVDTCSLAYTLECVACILHKLKEVFMHCMNPQRMHSCLLYSTEHILFVLATSKEVSNTHALFLNTEHILCIMATRTELCVLWKKGRRGETTT